MAKSAKTYSFTIAAGATHQLTVSGKFFRILAATGSLDVTSDQISLAGVGAGQGMLGQAFQRLMFANVSGAPNTVRVIIADEEFLDNSQGGGVIITTNKVPQSAAFVHTAPAVAAVNGQLLAANAARQYLLIQNNHASEAIYVRLDGAAATLASGVKVPAGASLELASCVSTLAINAIAAAANAAIVVVEA